MAWFNWFSNKNTAARADSHDALSDVLTSQQMDFTRPMNGARPHSAAQPAVTASAERLEQRRNERNAKRELLFQVVRESMVRVGVLSSAFKFKVLSLDQRGRSFLVMIELSAEFSGEVEKLAQIESMIAQTARHRFEIIVQAVYWRYFNATPAASTAASTAASPSVAAPTPLLGALQAPISRPAPLFSMEGPGSSAHKSPMPQNVAQPASRAAAAAASSKFQTTAGITASFPIIGATASQKAAARVAKPTLEELSDDEVAAFRRALAAGAAQAMASPTSAPAAARTPSTSLKPAPSLTAKPVPVAKPAPAPAKSVSASLEAARSKLLLTGYEDTEMADDDPMPALSGTQYGDLR
jgi:hypothetical protein